MVVLPSDLSSNTIDVVLPSDVLTHAWGGSVKVHALAPLATLVEAPDVRDFNALSYIYDVTITGAGAVFSDVANAATSEDASITFGVGSVQGRVIGVNGDTLTLVLDSPVEAIQETLASGDAAAVATLLSTLAVTQGNAPVFNPTTIRPDLDAALTVDLVAKADLVDWKSVTCKARLILGTLRILHFRAQIRSPICFMTCAKMQVQRLMASLIQPKPRPISAVMLRAN